MKNIIFVFTLLIASVLLLCACGGSAEHKTLHEAADIHMEAFKIKKELDPKIEQLVQISNGILVQGRELTPKEIKFTKDVELLSVQFQYWDKNHLEVPGFEHEGHDHSGHDHEHNHDHSTPFNLPADDILIIQKEFRDSIIRMQQKTDYLLQRIEN